MLTTHRRRKRFSPRADLFYGYDYNPAWPSILSVAHNEFDGGQLFVITDPPCVLVPRRRFTTEARRTRRRPTADGRG